MFVLTSTFRFICIICCIISATSYKISYRPSFDDRNERAVTEWRFRRNYLLDFPYWVPAHGKKIWLNDEGNDFNQVDEYQLHDKRFLVPQFMHPIDERKK